MKLLRGRRASRPRVFVLGLDGTPHSYLKAETSAGRLPNLAALFEEGASVPMRSSLPSVSGTAWMTVFTGREGHVRPPRAGPGRNLRQAHGSGPDAARRRRLGPFRRGGHRDRPALPLPLEWDGGRRAASAGPLPALPRRA